MGRKYFCYFCVLCRRFIVTTFWNDIDIKCRHFKISDICHNCERIHHLFHGEIRMMAWLLSFHSSFNTIIRPSTCLISLTYDNDYKKNTYQNKHYSFIWTFSTSIFSSLLTLIFTQTLSNVKSHLQKDSSTRVTSDFVYIQPPHFIFFNKMIYIFCLPKEKV